MQWVTQMEEWCDRTAATITCGTRRSGARRTHSTRTPAVVEGLDDPFTPDTTARFAACRLVSEYTKRSMLSWKGCSMGTPLLSAVRAATWNPTR
jgi:hypothetical protein